jgi:hypothetical protein
MLSRRLAIALAALAAGGGLAACADRQNESQSNDGGEPGSLTSPNAEPGGGTEGSSVPPSVTETIGTLPTPEQSPDTGGETDPGDADSDSTGDGEG